MINRVMRHALTPLKPSEAAITVSQSTGTKTPSSASSSLKWRKKNLQSPRKARKKGRNALKIKNQERKVRASCMPYWHLEKFSRRWIAARHYRHSCANGSEDISNPCFDDLQTRKIWRQQSQAESHRWNLW